jgi:hypothetical protein
MRMRWPGVLRRLVPLASALALAGCGGRERNGEQAGPILVAVDSVLLAEADTLYLGNPYALAVDPYDGSFYVSDFFADRVLRFGRGGRLVRTYGRPGDGPGEFHTPTLTWPVDSLTVAAADNDHHLIHLFARQTGAHIRSVPYQGRLGLTRPVVLESSVWMPARNRGTGTSALRSDPRTDSVRYLVPLPEEYLASFRGLGRFAAFHTMGMLTGWADTVAVGMGGVNHVLLAGVDGAVFDTLSVPAIHRRGVPRNVVLVFDGDPGKPTRDLFRASSMLAHLFRRPDGSLVLVHHDADLEGELPGGLITARVFVSVVAPGRDRACVDAELPVSRDARPIQGFRGDTLFLLDRRITAGERLETWIVSYRIDTDGCDWLKIE